MNITRIALASGLSLVALTGTAQAASVATTRACDTHSCSSPFLLFRDDQGDANAVTLTAGSAHAVFHDSVPLTASATSGCVAMGLKAVCQPASSSSLGLWEWAEISLGAGDDTFAAPQGETLPLVINAGRGQDVVAGGAGDDAIGTVESRHPAEADQISCGDGYDRVFADALDTVAADCENVTIR